MPHSQETKPTTTTRSNIVTNSTKTLKMAHIKKKSFSKIPSSFAKQNVYFCVAQFISVSLWVSCFDARFNPLPSTKP